MARKVKLQDTGEISTNEIAYKAPNNKYYSSKEAYEKIQNNNIYRQKCIDYMYEVLGYKSGMILPTYFYKSLKGYEALGYDVFYQTMILQNKSVQWALSNKNFNGETAKIMYLMAIYNNNVMDVYKQIIAEKKSYVQNKFDEVEEISETVSRKQDNKNISKFLED